MWVIDLRGFGFGQRYRLTGVDGARPTTEVEAMHAAYALLRRLEQERGGELRGGPASAARAEALPGTGAGRAGLDGETLFRFAVDEFAARKEYDTAGGRNYGHQELRLVRRELGARRIAEFEAPQGFDVLRAYRDEMRDRGLGPKTRSNRLNTAMQVLAFCAEWGWLRSLPRRPKAIVAGETIIKPSFDWISEADFRLLRAELGRGKVRAGSAKFLKDRASIEDYFARRRLYLSFAFYTGLHTADLDALTAETVLVDFDRYWRHNTKASRFVKPITLEMPDQLKLDVEAELTRLGRRWRPGEAIAGGRWPNVQKVLAGACARAGLSPVNPRILRRSCARMYALMGWPERDISEVLGHVDQRMIREVYVRIPVEERSPEKVPWTLTASALPWLGMRRPRKILPFERQPSLFAAVGDDDTE
jgi:integrase